MATTLSSDNRDMIIKIAELFLNSPYEFWWEGCLPGDPTDCSNFTQKILGYVWIEIERASFQQKEQFSNAKSFFEDIKKGKQMTVTIEVKEESNLDIKSCSSSILNYVEKKSGNINNNQDNLEEEEMEQENINEVGEENLGDEVQAEQQNEGNEEPKITTTVEVFIPENQNANEE